jgi:hypothetical protein
LEAPTLLEIGIFVNLTTRTAFQLQIPSASLLFREGRIKWRETGSCSAIGEARLRPPMQRK